MGIAQSKEQDINNLVKELRSNLIGDNLNREFIQCINNTPDTVKNKIDMRRFNIITPDLVSNIFLSRSLMSIDYHTKNVGWSKYDDKETLPYTDLAQIEKEVTEIYFMSDPPDSFMTNNEWYIIGKLITGAYFTMYLFLPNIAQIEKRKLLITFYSIPANIKFDPYYEKYKKYYVRPFFSFIDSL